MIKLNINIQSNCLFIIPVKTEENSPTHNSVFPVALKVVSYVVKLIIDNNYDD